MRATDGMAVIGPLLDRLEAAGIVMHGILIAREGQTIAEGYWKPFTADFPHRLYSASKTVTALAIGLLADEGRLSLDDAVATYFPDYLPETPHRWTLQTTVRDLLRMATPNDHTSYKVGDANWPATFFQMRPDHPPGAIFNYDTAGTTVLCALVERLSGESLLDYLRPRLLEPIGISKGIRCVRTPDGTMWGGSGMICTLRDLARFGQLMLQGGLWAGRQLISADYIRQMTTRQIDNRETGAPGYGYQTWILPHGGYQLYGMGSQYAFCYPDKGLVFACVADTQLQGPRAGEVIAQCAEWVYQMAALLPDAPDEAMLARLDALALAPVSGASEDAAAASVQGVWYDLEENPMRIDALRFDFAQGEGVLTYVKAGQERSLRFGLGGLVQGRFPERYFGLRVGTREREYACLASGAWIMPGTLSVYVHIVDDYLGGLQMTFAFKGGDIAVRMIKAAEWFLEDYQGFAGGTARK